MNAKDGLDIFAFARAEDFEQWLERNADESPGCWLKIAKKASGIESITYDEAVDVALCFGWIDGKKGSYDHEWFLQRFTRRRPRSIWSKTNTRRVASLSSAGRMRPAGRAEVEKAKADGRWDAAYGGSREIAVPEDLREYLDAHAQAAASWASLSSANRYAVLFRLLNARRPETRAQRFEQFTSRLLTGEEVLP